MAVGREGGGAAGSAEAVVVGGFGGGGVGVLGRQGHVSGDRLGSEGAFARHNSEVGGVCQGTLLLLGLDIHVVGAVLGMIAGAKVEEDAKVVGRAGNVGVGVGSAGVEEVAAKEEQVTGAQAQVERRAVAPADPEDGARVEGDGRVGMQGRNGDVGRDLGGEAGAGGCESEAESAALHVTVQSRPFAPRR